MGLSKWAEDFKNIRTIVVVIVFLAATVVGAEERYAKRSTVQELARHQTYSNLQGRLKDMTSPYMICCKEGRYYVDFSKMSKEDYQIVQWLESEIKKLEIQMGIRK